MFDVPFGLEAAGYFPRSSVCETALYYIHINVQDGIYSLCVFISQPMFDQTRTVVTRTGTYEL